ELVAVGQVVEEAALAGARSFDHAPDGQVRNPALAADLGPGSQERASSLQSVSHRGHRALKLSDRTVRSGLASCYSSPDRLVGLLAEETDSRRPPMTQGRGGLADHQAPPPPAGGQPKFPL